MPKWTSHKILQKVWMCTSERKQWPQQICVRPFMACAEFGGQKVLLQVHLNIGCQCACILLAASMGPISSMAQQRPWFFNCSKKVSSANQGKSNLDEVAWKRVGIWILEEKASVAHLQGEVEVQRLVCSSGHPARALIDHDLHKWLELQAGPIQLRECTECSSEEGDVALSLRLVQFWIITTMYISSLWHGPPLELKHQAWNQVRPGVSNPVATDWNTPPDAHQWHVRAVLGGHFALNSTHNACLSLKFSLALTGLIFEINFWIPRFDPGLCQHSKQD